MAVASGVPGWQTAFMPVFEFPIRETSWRGFSSMTSTLSLIMFVMALTLTSCSSSSGPVEDDALVSSVVADSDKGRHHATRVDLGELPVAGTKALSSAQPVACQKYPDVWARSYIQRDGTIPTGFQVEMHLDSPCEVWARGFVRSGRGSEVVGMEFFSGREVFSSAALSSSARKADWMYGADRLTLSDGSTVEWDPGAGGLYGPCTLGTTAALVLRDKQGLEIQRVAWLIRLPRFEVVPDMRCEEVEVSSFTRTVRFVESASLFPLADGTFIAMDTETGMLIRLDSGLRSRSRLAGTSFLLMSHEEVVQIGSELAWDMPQVFASFQNRFANLGSGER